MYDDMYIEYIFDYYLGLSTNITYYFVLDKILRKLAFFFQDYHKQPFDLL